MTEAFVPEETQVLPADNILRDDEGRSYLSESAKTIWRISGALSSMFFLSFLLFDSLFGFLPSFFPDWAKWPLYIIIILFAVLQTVILPSMQWKRWRYRVDKHEIDLQRGVFIVKRTLIPIKRVQHVDTRQGPLYRLLDLASVTISTAGDIHEIPALSVPVADDLRKTISAYARIAREDL